MTIRELFAAAESGSKLEIGDLAGCYFNHLPEVPDTNEVSFRDLKSDRVKIRAVRDHSYDGRRIWRLAVVWFDGMPVMVFQNAGREGDDFAKRFVVGSEALKKMSVHIMELKANATPFSEIETHPMDQDMPELTYFYDQDLNGMFAYHYYY